jgi:hypothetical protein
VDVVTGYKWERYDVPFRFTGTLVKVTIDLK